MPSSCPRVAPTLTLALVTLALLAGGRSGPDAATAATTAQGIQAPTVLSVEPNDTPIDGWNGWLVWSRRNAENRFDLVARSPDGHAVVLPVPAQPHPIDASIGPDPDDRPLVVYSRCTNASGATPTGCDVYRIDPRTGVGGPVPAAAQPDVDERLPAVWHNRIAFARPVTAGNVHRTAIAVARLDGPAPKRPTIFGPTKERRKGRSVTARTSGPEAIDLRGSRVAHVWRTSDPGKRWRLVLNKHAGTGKTLLSASTTRRTISQLGRPVLSGSDVVVPLLRTGARSRSALVRVTLSGRRSWTLASGFAVAQTEHYGSALTGVARTASDDLVVVRRLASDGRWRCEHPAVPDARGCEILRLPAADQPWRRISGR